MSCSDWRRHPQHVGVGEGPLEEEEEEEEESLFKANAVNEEDPERDRATPEEEEEGLFKANTED